ncbi:MAG: aldehyde ferredoxin oxidoreductase [Proteobacteria bacterium]|nr:aldehyde ferredoxin oxidoreductase [Pseudomonadota bacterium]
MKNILRVNMSEVKTFMQGIPTEYMGLAGRGLTSTIVAREVPPTCEPLGSHNKLVIAPGAFAGTNAPNSGRLSIGVKSPLTGGIKESNVGGTAAYRLGRLGVGAIIVEGFPEKGKLYVLRVTKSGGELIAADEYRSMRNYELAEKLQEKYGKKIAVLSIGPVGEMRLPVSTIASTDTSGFPCRHAGRGGTGAVMGSKGLKAIVIDDEGGESAFVANPERFKEGMKVFVKAIQDHPETGQNLKLYGTNGIASLLNVAGAYPTRNFSAGTFEGIDKVNGEYMYELITKRGGKPSHAGCSMCIIQCSNVYVDEKGDYITSALEYETIGLFGANCGISDLDIIARADRLCDDCGMDTMEMGGTIGVAMEADVKAFGDGNGLLELLEEVGKGTPLGRILGSGAWSTGRAFGARRVPVVKKQSISMYEPRGIHGMGVTYATTPMGADHTAGWVLNFNLEVMGGTLDPHKPDGQVDISKQIQVVTAAMDCTGLCMFVNMVVGGTPEGGQGFLEMMSGLYGADLTLDDAIKLGIQVIKTERDFNKAAGLTNLDDRLPEFMKEEKLPPHNVTFTVPDEELDRMWGDL